METSINLLNENDAEELFEFEIVNRMFFEKMVLSRGFFLQAFHGNQHLKTEQNNKK